MKDKLLKLYRSRYQTLSKQSSTSAPDSKSAKMYARYKKEGPAILKQYKAGQVSKQDFEKWINSTRLK